MKKDDVTVANAAVKKVKTKISDDVIAEVVEEVKTGLDALDPKVRAQLTIMPNGTVCDTLNILTPEDRKILSGK